MSAPTIPSAYCTLIFTTSNVNRSGGSALMGLGVNPAHVWYAVFPTCEFKYSRNWSEKHFSGGGWRNVRRSPTAFSIPTPCVSTDLSPISVTKLDRPA